MLSTVELYGDIGFDASYREVRDFKNVMTRDDWFASRSSQRVFTAVNYDKVEKEFKLEIGYGDALSFSYCIVRMEDGTDVYAFVDGVRVVNDRTVAFRLTVDEWQMNAGIRGAASIRSGVLRRRTGDRHVKDVYPEPGVTGYRVSDTETPILFASFEGKRSNNINRSGRTEVLLAVVCYTVNDSDGDSHMRYAATPIVKYIDDETGLTTVGIDAYDMDPFNQNEHTWCTLDSLFLALDEYHRSGSHHGFAMSGVQYMAVVPWIGCNDATAVYRGDDRLCDCFDIPITNSQQWNKKTLTVNNYEVAFLWSEDYPMNSYPYRVRFVPSPERAVNVKDPLFLRSPFVSREVFSPNGSKVAELPDPFVTGITVGDTEEGITDYHTSAWGIYLIPVPSASGFNVLGVFSEQVQNATAENLLYTAIPEGRVFEIQGMYVDVTSQTWLDYVNTQRDTDRKMIAVNAVTGIASSAATGAIAGNAVGVASGAVSGVIGAVGNYANQILREEGIRNAPNRVMTMGTAEPLIMSGIAYNRISVSVLNTAEGDMLKEDIFRRGYVYDRYLKDIPFRVRKMFDFIEVDGSDIGGNMNEDSRKAIEEMLARGMTIWHDAWEDADATASGNPELADMPDNDNNPDAGIIVE